MSYESVAVPSFYVPMAKAALCLSCSSVFYVGPSCPNCASEQFATLARFTDRLKDGRHCRACGQALSRYPEETSSHFQQRRTCNPHCRREARRLQAREFWGIARRFWSQVDKTETCWLWTGAVSDTGYGNMAVAGRRWNVHRLSAALAGIVIPSGFELCHRCDVRNCVRPDHFFIGAHVENLADMVRKGRSSFGERRYNAKLTWARVSEIRSRAASGETQQRLADEYGIGQSQISAIVIGKSWTRNPTISPEEETHA